MSASEVISWAKAMLNPAMIPAANKPAIAYGKYTAQHTGALGFRDR